jgi:hypothetical protein
VLHRDGRELPGQLNLVLIRDAGRVVGGVITLRFLPALRDAEGSATTSNAST